MSESDALDAYRAELAELRVLLESQNKAFEQLTEKTAKLAYAVDSYRAEAKKERDVNALQTEAITGLIFLKQHDSGVVLPSQQEFYENLWRRLLALREELNPGMRRAAVEAAAGGGSSE